MSSMSGYIVEEEQGTFTGTARRHNGYFAGDFSEVPMATPRQLAALTALQPITFGHSPR
jgi:hypothetical protein